MTAHKLSLADEAVITDLLAKNSRLEEEIEYLHNELASMKTGPYSDLLKENRKLRHELAVLVHGVDAESERQNAAIALAHKVKMYEDALGEIAWSNNNEWQQDRAKQVLAQMRGVEL